MACKWLFLGSLRSSRIYKREGSWNEFQLKLSPRQRLDVWYQTEGSGLQLSKNQSRGQRNLGPWTAPEYTSFVRQSGPPYLHFGSLLCLEFSEYKKAYYQPHHLTISILLTAFAIFAQYGRGFYKVIKSLVGYAKDPRTKHQTSKKLMAVTWV
jgi:hypothetical protein